MPFCENCGNPMEEGDKYCHACGGTAGGAGSDPGVSPPGNQETAMREMAERRVKQRLELLQHIGMYIVINGFLVVIWALTGAGYPWFLWPLAGWGLGLAIHIVSYFIGSRGDSARQRMIDREMEKMKRGHGEQG